MYMIASHSGDDGQSTDVQSGILMKESENVYSLWCSGRAVCEGMLVTLKLLKRQDLVSTIARLLKPASDQIVSRNLTHGTCPVHICFHPLYLNIKFLLVYMS